MCKQRGLLLVRQAAAVKLFFVIVICTFYLISFSQIGTFAYQSFFKEPSRFAEGTVIGSVSVSKLSKEEATRIVQEKVNEWKTSTVLQLTYQEKTEALPTQLFTFQVEQSVEQAAAGQPSQLVVQFDEQSFSKLIEEVMAPLSLSSINLKKLKRDIMSIAANLQMGKQSIDLTNYFIEKQGVQKQPISEVMMGNLGESEAEVIAWVSNHPTIEIKGKSLFSLSAYLNKKSEPLSSEGMSIIASAIYQAILPTNFMIVERHTSRDLPNEIPLGYEAKVDKVSRDFRFYNPNTSTYTLQFKAMNNGFRVTLTGLPLVYQYVVKVGEIEYFTPKTIIQYSSLLSPGERRMKQKGKHGILAKVKKEIYDENNHLLKTEIVAEDFYPPSHNIEVRGLELGVDLSNNETNPTNDHQVPSEQDNQGESGQEQEQGESRNEQVNEDEKQSTSPTTSEQNTPSSEQDLDTELYEK
jgi:hypothetical protein